MCSMAPLLRALSHRSDDAATIDRQPHFRRHNIHFLTPGLAQALLQVQRPQVQHLADAELVHGTRWHGLLQQARMCVYNIMDVARARCFAHEHSGPCSPLDLRHFPAFACSEGLLSCLICALWGQLSLVHLLGLLHLKGTSLCGCAEQRQDALYISLALRCGFAQSSPAHTCVRF